MIFWEIIVQYIACGSVSSVAQSFLTLCEPMNRSTPGLSVHHQLPESTQTQVHRVGDDIKPSHRLSSASPPTLNLSQHQSLFQWVSSSHRWPKYYSFSFNISPFNEHQELISFRMDWFNLLAVHGTLKSLLHTTIQKHQFFSAQLSLWSNFHSMHDFWRKHSFDYGPLSAKWCLCF